MWGEGEGVYKYSFFKNKNKIREIMATFEEAVSCVPITFLHLLFEVQFTVFV